MAFRSNPKPSGPHSIASVVFLFQKNFTTEELPTVVVMRFGENALATIQGVRAKLEALKKGLPEGVEIVPVYDRGDLIERAVDSLTTSLLQELVIVSIVVLIFLLHVRSALDRYCASAVSCCADGLSDLDVNSRIRMDQGYGLL